MENKTNDVSVPDGEMVEDQEMQTPANTKLVMALKKITLDRIALEIEMHKKIFQTELEYQERFKQFDDKRRMIIAGDYVPTDEECKYEYADPAETIVETNERGIPEFWSTIFANLDLLNEMVQEHDHEVMSLLTDVRCVLLDNPMGYRLEFEFAENKYFSNKVLTKEYYFAESFDPNDPLNYDSLYVNRCKGCKIEWKSPEMNLTQKKVAKKMKNRNSNQIKTFEKMEKVDSFFNFFEPIEGNIEDASDDDKELLASDFDIGEIFRLNVVPRAIIYYTGEGIEDEYSEMDEFGEFDEDEEFDEEDEDEEEDDDDDDDGGEMNESNEKRKTTATHRHNKKALKAKGVPNGHKHKKNAKDKDMPPECQTQ